MFVKLLMNKLILKNPSMSGILTAIENLNLLYTLNTGFVCSYLALDVRIEIHLLLEVVVVVEGQD